MVNSVLDIDKPKPDYFFAALEVGLKFIKLDLHQQLALEKDYVTINTHQGLYQFTRLPFGVTSSPAIFQKTMDANITRYSAHSVCYIDDILVVGRSDAEHKANICDM